MTGGFYRKGSALLFEIAGKDCNGSNDGCDPE
jgi:hypothetical protein